MHSSRRDHIILYVTNDVIATILLPYCCSGTEHQCLIGLYATQTFKKITLSNGACKGVTLRRGPHASRG
jgi:hypothetical protein